MRAAFTAVGLEHACRASGYLGWTRLAKLRGDVYFWRVKLREAEIRRIASTIVARLEKAGLMRVTGGRDVLEQRIVAAFKANIRAEEDIEADAVRFAESHSRELVGMDRHKVLQLVKERLAKERGFTL